MSAEPVDVVTASRGFAERGVSHLLRHLGEDDSRDGLKDTPARVVRAMEQMTRGYQLDPADILKVAFDDDYDQMIAVHGVPFVSLCEHHMLPFTGLAAVGYVPRPGSGVVGLSKLARLVDVYACRLQVQERMTRQIADAIARHLDPFGIGVVIHGRHSCMALRGVAKPGVMTTSDMRGAMRENPETRAEFLALANGHDV